MRREGLVSTACACARFSVYILCRKIVRKRTGPQYPYVFGFCRFCRMFAHAHAVDTRPFLRIIEGLGTRLLQIVVGKTPQLNSEGL